MNSNRKNIIFIVSLVILNIIIKSAYLGVNSLDVDEPFTVFNAQVDFSDLFKMFQTENNPPFFRNRIADSARHRLRHRQTGYPMHRQSRSCELYR